MVQPVLHVLAQELAESERLRAFVERPASARVSEPLLPLVLAATWIAREGPLVCLFADDSTARDAAEAAGWFLGDENVGLLASRGVRRETELEPPAHLVGERFRALEVHAAGGLVCASALGFADGLPPLESRPEPLRLVAGDEPGVEDLAEGLVLAGYARVERVEERGQIAVRGGIVDIFPSTGREPVRVEFFGDEIESLRAFSVFTQRALHPLDGGADPAGGRAAARRRSRGGARRAPRRRRISSGSTPTSASCGARSSAGRSRFPAWSSSTSFRTASSTRSRRSGPPSPRAAWPRPSATSARSSRRGTA